jgi:hypothetical protein
MVQASVYFTYKKHSKQESLSVVQSTHRPLKTERRLPLKHPLQALLLADDHQMRMRTLSGKKKISIREGDRDYRVGLIMIVDHLNPFVVQADVVEVRKCKLSEVTEEEYLADGFTDQEDLFKGMQTYYPHLTPDSIVTIIKWENVRGFLVDILDELL